MQNSSFQTPRDFSELKLRLSEIRLQLNKRMFRPKFLAGHIILSFGLINPGANAASVLDVQPALAHQVIQTSSGTIYITNLNQHLNTRYLLEKNNLVLNIERSPFAKIEKINASGVHFVDGYQCDLWGKTWDEAVKVKKQNAPYYPLCDGRLYLIGSPIQHTIPAVEWSANFLRDHFGSFGDGVIDYYKNVTRDLNYQNANYRSSQAKNSASTQGPRPANIQLDSAISYADSHLNVKIKEAKEIKLGN